MDDFRMLGEIIGSEPEFRKFRNSLMDREVLLMFERLFPEIAEAALPVKLEKRVLHLKVENAAWRNELKFQESKIIEKINAFFHDERVERIRLTIF